MGKISRRMHEKLDFDRISAVEDKITSLEESRNINGILTEIAALHSYLDGAVIREELTRALQVPNKTDASVITAQLTTIAALRDNLKSYPLVSKYWLRYWQMAGERKIKALHEQEKGMLAEQSLEHTSKVISVIKAVHQIS